MPDESNIIFKDCHGDINLDRLKQLFDRGAFWARDRRIEDLDRAISASNPVISAWDNDRMVGFARATSDGVYRATIWDVVVDPDYQGLGLGRKLIETILAHPHMVGVEKVYLTTTHQQGFYERMGFEVNQTTTMILQRKEY
jgi:N-acetylglutamate synthase-like GNAT family acetyltransferase